MKPVFHYMNQWRLLTKERWHNCVKKHFPTHKMQIRRRQSTLWVTLPKGWKRNPPLKKSIHQRQNNNNQKKKRGKRKKKEIKEKENSPRVQPYENPTIHFDMLSSFLIYVFIIYLVCLFLLSMPRCLLWNFINFKMRIIITIKVIELRR